MSHRNTPNIKSNYRLQRSKDIYNNAINPNLPPARRRHFSCPDSTSRAESKLVPVLLRITAEPESAYVRFNALAYYALL